MRYGPPVNPSHGFREVILQLPGTLVQREVRTRGWVKVPPLALLRKWAPAPPRRALGRRKENAAQPM